MESRLSRFLIRGQSSLLISSRLSKRQLKAILLSSQISRCQAEPVQYSPIETSLYQAEIVPRFMLKRTNGLSYVIHDVTSVPHTSS